MKWSRPWTRRSGRPVPHRIPVLEQVDATEGLNKPAYGKVAKLLSPASVTIRTLDIGGDKLLGEQSRYKEANPFMGARAIRFCLEHPAIFKPQLRAILRASASGKVRILFPMITGVTELRRTRAVFEEAKEELQREGVPFDPTIPIGVMIETPSAAIIADLLAREADFSVSARMTHPAFPGR
jgi:phosphotransferase system enzyme I (PtsI)